jgi:hypothetical protein
VRNTPPAESRKKPALWIDAFTSPEILKSLRRGLLEPRTTIIEFSDL